MGEQPFLGFIALPHIFIAKLLDNLPIGYKFFDILIT